MELSVMLLPKRQFAVYRLPAFLLQTVAAEKASTGAEDDNVPASSVA